jgi:hypothetical protein
MSNNYYKNGVLALLIAFGMLIGIGDNVNDLIDQYSKFLTFLIIFEVAFICIFVKRIGPFNNVLSIFVTLFIIARVVSLIILPVYSFPIRHGLTSLDFSNALVLIAMLYPFFAIFCIGLDRIYYKNTRSVSFHQSNINIKTSSILYVILTSYIVYLIARFDFGVITQIMMYFVLVIDPWMVISTVLVIYISKTSTQFKFAQVAVVLILAVVASVAIGNKGYLMQLIFSFLLLHLTVAVEYKFRVKHYLYFIMTITAAFALYFVGNEVRDLARQYGSFAEAYHDLEFYKVYELITDNKVYVFSHFAERIAYLDYATRVIKNSSEYSNILSFPYYAQSLFDYIMPGTYFDVVRANNAIVFYDTYRYVPTYTEYLLEEYHSNQLTAFAELYVLGRGIFGAISIAAVFHLVFYLLYKHTLKACQNRFTISMVNLTFVQFYFGFLLSFGFDWLIERWIYTSISIFLIYIYLSRTRRRRPL